MNKKKISVLILVIVLLVVISVVSIKYYNSNQSETNIKMLEYNAPNIIYEKGYKIDKYENIENVAWLNENEVLTLTKKDNIKAIRDPLDYLFSCSIYNLNTKSSKDYKDVSINTFIGVSPDNKYVLYKEPLEIGYDILKILNLSTGEITEINSELNYSSGQYKWISNNKIIVSYINEWGIIDIYGKVYAKGQRDGQGSIVGIDDIKDLGDSVEGEFYYTTNQVGDECEFKICSIDVKTNKAKTIKSNKDGIWADKKGKTIIMDNYQGDWESIKEVKVMDIDGNSISDIKSSEGIWPTDVVLSPDGSKAAYVESERCPYLSSFDPNGNNEEWLKVIDMKTGDIKEIFSSTSMIDYNTEDKYPSCFCNITWNSTGTALSITNGYSRESAIYGKKIDTYIVSFDN